MDVDSAVNADDKEQLQVEETDDSCRVDFIGIVPLSRDADGCSTAECVGGDWSAEVKQEHLANFVKQEPDDVCSVLRVTFTLPQPDNLCSSLISVPPPLQ